MKVVNVHERFIPHSAYDVGQLLRTLASDDDRIWPNGDWPAMQFDRPLQVGATGGHGPIGYFVEEYVPGDRIVFHFLRPKGFNGTHGFYVIPKDEGCILRHEMRMRASFTSTFQWIFVFRPLHDALLEDALYKAAGNFGNPGSAPRWSWFVKFLRNRLRKKRQRS
ncbi:MAG TPA: hypothetical protein VN577_16440 [Terriglobales bacterium]|nr:hypothetical protein [Terriglobales bacterium]